LTALGDTLFPVNSIEEGIRQDFSSTAHFLVRLRILHPTIAVKVALYLSMAISWISSKVRQNENKIIGRVIISLLLLQLLAGLINVLLLAPVWMQLVHLLLSDSVWIFLVLYASATLNQGDSVFDVD